MSLRCLDNKTDLPLTSEELMALDTYEAEENRGLVHNPTWQLLMAQYAALREQQWREDAKCPGGLGMSPRDPAFNDDHDMKFGRCTQCGARSEG